MDQVLQATEEQAHQVAATQVDEFIHVSGDGDDPISDGSYDPGRYPPAPAMPKRRPRCQRRTAIDYDDVSCMGNEKS